MNLTLLARLIVAVARELSRATEAGEPLTAPAVADAGVIPAARPPLDSVPGTRRIFR